MNRRAGSASLVDMMAGHCLWLVLSVAFALAQLGGAAAHASAGNDLRVLTSSREGLTVSVAGLAPSWQEVHTQPDGTPLYELQLPGFSNSGPVGAPRVPGRGTWLVVPPGTRAELRVISEEWVPAGGRRLMVEPVPVIQRGEEGYDTGVSELLLLPGDELPDGLEIPEQAREAFSARSARTDQGGASLGEAGWWRGRQVVPLRITAARVDGAGAALQTLAAGTWEVRFVPDRASAGSGIPAVQARRQSGRNDAQFGGAFLNAELLADLPTEAAFHGVLPEAAAKAAYGAEAGQIGSPLGFESRLGVTKSKMHRVTYASLRSRNLLPDVPIRESQIRLYQRRYVAALDDGQGGAPFLEVEVPIHMVGEGDDFDGDDFFVFYGLRLRDDVAYTADLGNGPVSVPGAGDPFEQNNEANFYWLAASEPENGQPWLRMQTMTLPAAGGAPLLTYRRTEHVEEQQAFRENLPNVATDRLYYNNHQATEVTAVINPLYAPAPTGTDVSLQVGITGWNTLARPLRFELLTGTATTLLEDYTIANTGEVVRSYSVPPSAIAGASTRVRMTSTNTGLSNVFAYLNWVKISYDALYQATNNRLDFNLGTAAGPRSVEVTGFADGDLALYDITDPRRPAQVQLSAPNVVADGGTWKLSITADQTTGPPRQYFAVGSATGTGIEEYVSFRSSVALDPAVPTDTGGVSPDLLVITHPDFREALGRWVDHRVARSGGTLRVHVAEVQDIYDWYSGGLRDAWAIKRFANHAITRWNTWALVIVGDANENALGKEVLSSAREWSADWVPTHYHVQHASGFAPELMASDKWYTALQAGVNYPNDPFPFEVTAPWDMYTGRLPCNSVAELNRMIDKIITVETLQPGQTWRRRGIFFADDEWSNGLGIQAQSELTYKYGEVVFGRSERDSLANLWAARAAVPLDSVVVLLKPFLDAGFPYVLPPSPGVPPPRSLSALRAYTAATAVDPLVQALSRGGLVSHYQGHANPYVLSSEFWLEDRKVSGGRDDVDLLANTDKPWFFMGMGCHIADWAQNAVRSATVPNERSISEKMLLRGGAGASAIYASSGFEFISANKEFGEYIFRRWVDKPPSARLAGTGGGPAVPHRSRWMTGELMWAAEADVKADKPWYPYPEMLSQYVILGDPLMMLDAGEPVVTATLLGPPDQLITGEVDLTATDGTNLRTVTLVARDEAGIDRLEVTDSAGADLSSQIVTETLPVGATNHRLVNYTLAVPVRPFDHKLTVKVYDTGGPLPGDRHYELVLNLPQTAVFLTGGEVVDPDQWVFQAGDQVPFSAQVTSSAELNSGMTMTLTSETLALSGIAFNLAKGRELDVDFTAAASLTDAGATHAVVLTIDGHATEFVLQRGSTSAAVAGIGRVFNFPNPVRDNTRFVFESDVGNGRGVIRIFSVAGRTVASLEFAHAGAGRSIVDWNGRDGRGDELGNGTYLYRIEVDGPGGRVVSDMQRLVMMR